MAKDCLRGEMVKILKTAMFNKTAFKKQINKLKQLYVKTNFDEFTECFIHLLKRSLIIEDGSSYIDNILEFSAIFVVNIDPKFLQAICIFLINSHEAQDRIVRFRICQFFALILTSLGEDAIIEDVLYDDIAKVLLERIQDRSPKVRAQAVLAMRRLQDPDEDCQIINVYLWHLARDPHAEVREKILNVIARNKKTLLECMKRIHDISPTVQKAAYKFISKITVKSLTIGQRETVLNVGLNDVSPMVADIVKNVVLPAWLLQFDKSYIALLRGLDADNNLETSILALETLLKKDKRPWPEILKDTDRSELTLLIPIEKLSTEKVILWRSLIEFISKISEDEMENVLPDLTPFCDYIQNYINHMKAKSYEFWEEKNQEVILFQLFDMIKFYDLSDENGRQCLHQLILNTLKHTHQSERIVSCMMVYLKKVVSNIDERIDLVLDIVNELRMPTQMTKNQSQKNINTLSEKDLHEIRMEVARMKVRIIEQEEHEYNAIQAKQYLVAEKIKQEIDCARDEMHKLNEQLKEDKEDEILEEIFQEKNDTETITSCLKIITSVLKSADFNVLTPSLRTLMDNLALINIDHPNKTIRRLALFFLGICCTLDVELAKKHIYATFLLTFSMEQECQDVCGTALMVIFDLLCIFGLEPFSIVLDDQGNHERTNIRNRTVRLYNNHDDSLTGTRVEDTENFDCSKKLMELLINLLNNEHAECRRIATTGLIKLLSNKVVFSARLLSHIIIQLHNPALKSDYSLMKFIVSFLNYYTAEVPQGQDLLRDSYFISLKMLENTTNSMTYCNVNTEQVSNLILTLTRSDVQKDKISNVHNELAHKIVAELDDNEMELNGEVLAKALLKLQLNFKTEDDRTNLINRVTNLASKMKDNNSRLLKYVKKFEVELKSDTNNQAPVVQNNEDNIDEGVEIDDASSQSEDEMMNIRE